MKRLLRIVWRTAKWTFFVVLLSVLLLAAVFVFRRLPVPAALVDALAARCLPQGVGLHVDSVDLGLRHGLSVRGLKIVDREKEGDGAIVVSADLVEADPFGRHVLVVGARYPRLPDSYYAPENKERNARVECELPNLPRFSLTLVNPDILGIVADRVVATVEVTRDRVTVDRIRLDWPDADAQMSINGFCYVDLGRQTVYGEVRGLARQANIRPMLVALDVPVSLPYFDGFTEVPSPVPSWCGWKVNLVNNDLDLYLDLHPTLGRYNAVPMSKADGKIHLHVYTREDFLNYMQTIGPIKASGKNGRSLEGTVTVAGTNGYNTVEVNAKSNLPLAEVLRIAGFEGDYVDDDVVGESSCQLQFRFPRAMTDNYGLLNGKGHVEVKHGQLMRMKGFRGLLEAMPSVAPAVSWFTDTTQASSDYVIENGVVRTDSTYIEGSLFSIKMYGALDLVANSLDYTVRVQFTKKDSLVGKLLHPLTWPFTKLLLEFKLTGTPEHPKWKYISVVDRVVEAVK
ncbi:MAG: hypothetical protein IKE55_04620 [Kiritimatiellae bacterium]|nr:hypothetical protein [Kiritimatiellia bacterium]